jgi:hypothetical protein
MKLIVFFFMTLFLVNVSAQLGGLVGGYSQVDLSDNSNSSVETANALVVKTYPFLNYARLISAETQVVAGTNTKLTYQDIHGFKYELIVFNQPWTNTLRITSAKRVA